MSKKKIILAGLGFLVALGVIVGIRVIGGNQGEELVEPGGESLGSEEVEEAELVLYEDDSGFSFKYPGDLLVEDKTEEVGEEYYTLLLIGADGGKRGNRGDKDIRVEIRDTEYKTVDEWLEKDEKAPKGAKLAGAVALDEISAKQYAKDNKIWTVAIDLGALYSIEGVKDGGNLEATYNRLVETFKFSRPEAEKGNDTSAGGGGGSAGGGNVIYEAEEVIQ